MQQKQREKAVPLVEGSAIAKQKSMQVQYVEPAPQTPRPSYDSLIQKQHTDGYWMASSEPLLSKFIYDDLITDTEMEGLLDAMKIKVSGVDQRCVYLTLVALYILYEEFDEKKGEWKLLAKKAKDFLTKNV